MSYQNPTQENYGVETTNHNQQQHLLNPNVGVPNSSRGAGTTLSEITSKLRFLNCSASLFVLVFYTLPRFVNPIKLAGLLASPVQLVLEVILGCCALSHFVVEAQIPLIALRVLDFVRGGVKVDLDTAKGRTVVLVVMVIVCGMIQYLTFVSKGGGGYSEAVTDNSLDESVDSDNLIGNGNATTIVSNATSLNSTMDVSVPVDTGSSTIPHKATTGIFSIIIQSTIISPTMWILISLIIYTFYIMQNYPDYVHYRAYPDPADASRNNNNNITNNAGYQNSGAPSWAQPAAV